MADATRARILVLDDDALVRRALERVANARANVVDLTTVGTPDEVLERLAAGPPYDLIVCDYRLKIDGRATTSADLLRELERRGLPIAVMTGDVESIAADLAHLPALEKPLRLEDILVHLRGR